MGSEYTGKTVREDLTMLSMRAESAAQYDAELGRPAHADTCRRLGQAAGFASKRIRELEAANAAMESVLQALHDGCPETRGHLRSAGIAQDAGQEGGSDGE